MKIFVRTLIAIFVFAVSLKLSAQEQSVGPTMSADALFKSCENGLLYEKSLNDSELLTTQAHVEAGIDSTFCKAYVQGVFEGARYAYFESSPGKFRFCPNEKSLDDFVREMISLREMIPELGREGRMASQDIIQILSLYWNCEQQ